MNKTLININNENNKRKQLSDVNLDSISLTPALVSVRNINVQNLSESNELKIILHNIDLKDIEEEGLKVSKDKYKIEDEAWTNPNSVEITSLKAKDTFKISSDVSTKRTTPIMTIRVTIDNERCGFSIEKQVYDTKKESAVWYETAFIRG